MANKVHIKNGKIIDGTGAIGFIGDILIEGDTIVDILAGGSIINDVDEVIDATGLVVSPGFIDAHAHSDAYIILEPDAPSKISQGITTEINGQCGGSIAPRYGEARLSSDWAALLGERLTWRSLAEYRAVFAAANPAINTVQFIGHNTLRSAVVGYAARAASEDELKTMERMLAAAMDEGGWGLTTGLIYQPGKYSTPSEVERLSRIAAERGGIYATHMRSEGDAILEAIDEVIALARATGIRAEISHLKTSGKANWHKIDAVIDKVAGGIDEGVLLGADRYPFCAAGTDLDIVLPDWAQEGAAKGEMARFADPALRDRIVAELNASPRDWSTVMIGGTWHAENKIFSGRRVSEICGEMTVGERIVKILEKDGCKTSAFFFGMSEENLNRIMAIDWIVPGSDASLRAPWGPLGADYPHPRAYATMPEFLRLALNASRSSVERIVERMTSIPAARFGIRRRGVLKRGNFADIAIWSESEFEGQSTYAKPHQFSLGMKYVMVNGKISYRDGRFTGERGGRFLEK